MCCEEVITVGVDAAELAGTNPGREAEEAPSPLLGSTPCVGVTVGVVETGIPGGPGGPEGPRSTTWAGVTVDVVETGIPGGPGGPEGPGSTPWARVTVDVVDTGIPGGPGGPEGPGGGGCGGCHRNAGYVLEGATGAGTGAGTGIAADDGAYAGADED